MDELDAPAKVCGYSIKTRMQIVLSCVLPNIVQLIVYITITVVDFGLVVQHFLVKNVLWGSLTLTFILCPAILCFTIIAISPWQWPNKNGGSGENKKFFIRQFLNLVLFPFGAIYR